MSEQKNSLALPIILLGVNLFAFPNPESSSFTATIYHLLNGMRKTFNNYACDIYTENNSESDYPFSVTIHRANVYGEAVAFNNGKVTYPLLEQTVIDFLNESIIRITALDDQNNSPKINLEQIQVVDHSIQRANRILTTQRQAESLSAAIEQEAHYYNKEAFYMGLENGLELYCMDYTGEVKLRFDEQEQIHVIKDALSLLYELRVRTLGMVEQLPQLSSEDKSPLEIQDYIDQINPKDDPELYALFYRYLHKLNQLTKHLKTPEKFIRIAMKDGVLLHSILHSL